MSHQTTPPVDDQRLHPLPDRSGEADVVAAVDEARVEQTARLLAPLVPAGTARGMAMIQYATILGSVLLSEIPGPSAA